MSLNAIQAPLLGCPMDKSQGSTSLCSLGLNSAPSCQPVANSTPAYLPAEQANFAELLPQGLSHPGAVGSWSIPELLKNFLVYPESFLGRIVLERVSWE